MKVIIIVGVCFNFMKIVLLMCVIKVVKVVGKNIIVCLVYIGLDEDKSLEFFLFIDLDMLCFDVYLYVDNIDFF